MKLDLYIQCNSKIPTNHFVDIDTLILNYMEGKISGIKNKEEKKKEKEKRKGRMKNNDKNFETHI